jgi:uncharacterized protein YdhG (YjbR/CyaY superfamily)
MKSFPSVDAYIASFPRETQKLLEQMRKTIKKAAPMAEEKISYGMPAYRLQRYLLYFGAFKNHISLFPTAAGIKGFKKKLKGYTVSKGTIQFPYEKPLPLDLIADITKLRVQQEAMNN